jgi:hypothetical protein
MLRLCARPASGTRTPLSKTGQKELRQTEKLPRDDRVSYIFSVTSRATIASPLGINTFLGFGVSVRDVPQRLKPEGFIELYRRSKDLLHPALDTVKPKRVGIQ